MFEKYAGRIARRIGTNVDEVRMYQEMSLDEAVAGFLSPNQVRELIDSGAYHPSKNELDASIIKITGNLSLGVADALSRTEQGGIWIAVRNAESYFRNLDAADHASSLNSYNGDKVVTF